MNVMASGPKTPDVSIAIGTKWWLESRRAYFWVFAFSAIGVILYLYQLKAFIIDFVLTERKLAHGPVKFPARLISHFVMNIIMAKRLAQPPK